MHYRVATKRPIKKVIAIFSGALVAVVAWALKQFANIEIPGEVQAALIILVSAAAAYLTPIREGEIEAAPPREELVQ